MIDYWATNPANDEVLHAIRGIIITAPAAASEAANDNVPASSSTITAANDNDPIAPLAATGTTQHRHHKSAGAFPRSYTAGSKGTPSIVMRCIRRRSPW